MRSITLISFSLMICSPLFSLAASTNTVLNEQALREECSASSQAEMRDCLIKKAKDSQKALKLVEANVFNTLSKWDEDKNYIDLAKAKLTKSNNEFNKYRETQCEFSVSLIGGGAGNSHEIGRLACVTELNNRRAEQLRSSVIKLPMK
jgi:uncharacterized protein YecT (DUF1311 family)